MTTLTIGQIAKQVGISNDTIRLYERYGLIDEPLRSTNGYRQYPFSTVARLRFIRRAKAMGFTLKEIKELLAVHQKTKSHCKKVRLQAETKLKTVEQKMNELSCMKQALQVLIQTCHKQNPNEPCLIISILEQSESVEESK